MQLMVLNMVSSSSLSRITEILLCISIPLHPVPTTGVWRHVDPVFFCPDGCLEGYHKVFAALWQTTMRFSMTDECQAVLYILLAISYQPTIHMATALDFGMKNCF